VGARTSGDGRADLEDEESLVLKIDTSSLQQSRDFRKRRGATVDAKDEASAGDRDKSRE
jgi:hypothetical protein